MALRKRLAAWQRAGLIDAAAVERIASFEAARRGPSALMVVAVLGGLTIGLGCISLVAANWQEIGGRVKLSLDLALLVCLAAAISRAVHRQQRVLAETLIAVDYLLVLASLALVGQIYQLGTPMYQALLGWTLATVALLLLARSRALAFMWVAGLTTTYASTLEPLADGLQNLIGDLPIEAAIIIAGGFAFPLLLRAGKCVLVHRNEYGAHTYAMAYTSTWVASIGAAASTFVWYADIKSNDHDEIMLAMLAAAIPTVLAIALARRLWPGASTDKKILGPGMFAFAWLGLALGASFPRDDWPIMAALWQLTLLALWAGAASSAQDHRRFGALTALIALRILIVYFEVFGSLLSTGIGLVSGGLLTLALAYAWHRFAPARRHRQATADTLAHTPPKTEPKEKR